MVGGGKRGVAWGIDPKGEMLSTLPLFSAAVLTANVALLEGETLYVRFGDWFAWLTTALSVVIIFARIHNLFSSTD